MQVTQLDHFFDVTQYNLCAKAATLRLVSGEIVVRAQYEFRNAVDSQKGPRVNVCMIVTPEQSAELKTILAAVLQATNDEIELQTGWTKWIPPEIE